jgi:hypothetical protein
VAPRESRYSAAVGRWDRYWFAAGGRYGAAILRIAIATAVLLTLHEMSTTWPDSAPGEPGPDGPYKPLGLWLLLGHTVPPTLLISLLWVVAWIATLAMLLGAFSRASTVVSVVAGAALAALYYSGTRSWSHQFNVVFLAELAFVGARGGDALSLDAVVRARRGQPPIDVPNGYQWSLRLTQLAVAVMFLSGMWHKVRNDMSLHWALSDNLRHHLLLRYDLGGLPRPAIVEWMIDDTWKFRTAAMLNLISQTLPIGACIFVRRPVIRAVCGAFFVIETIALAVVMQLWNPYWLPLAAVFVDWDALLAKLRKTPAPPVEPPAPTRPSRAIRIFIAVFVVYDLFTAFYPTVDQRLGTYPFSGFPMFATIRARKPYGEHLPYSVPGGHFELQSTRPLDPADYRWLDHQYRFLYMVHDPDDLRGRLATILGEARNHYPDHDVRTIRFYVAILEAPAYPAPAQLVHHDLGIAGEYHSDGRFRSMLGTARVGHLVYYRDDVPTPIELGTVPFETIVADSKVLVTLAPDDAGGSLPWVIAVERRRGGE